jgi:hypothetical protein
MAWVVRKAWLLVGQPGEQLLQQMSSVALFNDVVSTTTTLQRKTTEGVA